MPKRFFKQTNSTHRGLAALASLIFCRFSLILPVQLKSASYEVISDADTEDEAVLIRNHINEVGGIQEYFKIYPAIGKGIFEDGKILYKTFTFCIISYTQSDFQMRKEKR